VLLKRYHLEEGNLLFVFTLLITRAQDASTSEIVKPTQGFCHVLTLPLFHESHKRGNQAARCC